MLLARQLTAICRMGFVLIAAPLAQADSGHDHGLAPVAAVTVGTSPRFAAASDDFEWVGVLNSQQLSLLDAQAF